MKETQQSRPLARPKVNANGSKNPTLSFRVRGDLYNRLKASAETRGYSLSEAIERRLMTSFELEEQISLSEEIKTEMRGTIATLKDKIDVIKKNEILLWPDKNTRILGETFALTVIAAQQQFGQNWRESGSVVAVVFAVMRDVMTKFGRPGAEFDTLPNRARIDEATSNIAKSIVETFAGIMPPLSKLERPKEQSPMTGHARIVTTFRDRTTGKILETTTGPEFDRNNPQDRLQSGPEYRAALEKYRPRRDSIDIETSIMHVLQDGSSAWDALPEDEAGTRLVGAVEAAADFEPIRGLLPASIEDRALLDEARAPDKDGDATPSNPAAPPTLAPTRRRKAKAGA